MNHSQRFKIKEFNQGSQFRFPGDDSSPQTTKRPHPHQFEVNTREEGSIPILVCTRDFLYSCPLGKPPHKHWSLTPQTSLLVSKLAGAESRC